MAEVEDSSHGQSCKEAKYVATKCGDAAKTLRRSQPVNGQALASLENWSGGVLIFAVIFARSWVNIYIHN